LENRLPGPLSDIAALATLPITVPLDLQQVNWLGAEVGLDYVKSWTGSHESVPAEGVCGHIFPHQKGPIIFLPGYESNGQWDFSWNHSYPWSDGFGSPSGAEGGGPVYNPAGGGSYCGC
jgi:hypothetical protein